MWKRLSYAQSVCNWHYHPTHSMNNTEVQGWAHESVLGAWECTFLARQQSMAVLHVQVHNITVILSNTLSCISLYMLSCIVSYCHIITISSSTCAVCALKANWMTSPFDNNILINLSLIPESILPTSLYILLFVCP